MTGTLYGLGVGPGDPELITMKALRCLQSSPVVAYPAGRNDQPGFAQSIIDAWIHSDQLQLPLMFPYVFDPTQLECAWVKASQQVWHYLNQGQDVAFVAEGDISFYSTFTYLAQTLQRQHANVAIKAIPGVCSPMAAASILGIPLTVQSQRLAVLPAIYGIEELEQVITWADVLVLMKVGSIYPKVWQFLKQYNLLQQSYIVERATTDAQIVYADLSNYPNLKLPYFSILISQIRSEQASKTGSLV